MGQRASTDGAFVFPALRDSSKHLHADSIGTAMARLQGRSKEDHDETAPLYHLEHFTVHDLRRSAATLWTEKLNAEPLLVEQMLSHAPPRLMATYNHAQRWNLQSDVWRRWANLIGDHQLEGSELSNIVPLHASRPR